MSFPAPSFSFALISKIAALQPTVAPTVADAPILLSGFIDYLRKEAGLSPEETIGMVCFLADYSPLHKQADAGVGALAGAPGGAAVKTVVPPPASLSLLDKARMAADLAGKSIKDPVLSAKALGVAHSSPLAGELTHSLADKDWRRGLKAVGGAGFDWLTDPKNLKTIAPYAISGLGTFLGAKALGAGTGTAALAGLAGGAAGGYGYNHWPEIQKQLQRPAAPPVAAPAVAAEQQQALAAAEKQKQEVAATAQGIQDKVIGAK